MSTLTGTYTAEAARPLERRARTGGPRGPRRHRDEPGNRPETTPNDWFQRLNNTSHGSHMPLDTGLHWELRNPLNIIPAFVLLMFLIGIVGLLVA